MIDYEALAVRSLDETPSPEAWGALRVWADALEAAGDPRGSLIAMEHAMRAQPVRRRELMQAMHDHALANASVLLGPLEEMMRYPRAMTLDWRAGQLYGAWFDTRYLSTHAKRAAGDLVSQAIAAPVAAGLRRLHVRARGERDVQQVMDALTRGAPVLPLEELVVIIGVRPRFGPHGSFAPNVPALLERYRGLRMFAQDHWLHMLTFVQARPAALVDAIARPAAAAVPETVAGRVVLGRALLRPEPELRAAALQRLDQLGPRGAALVETLMLLLAPGMVTPQAPIVATLARLGEHARSALSLLAKITGRVGRYDEATRSAAGTALATLRG